MAGWDLPRLCPGVDVAIRAEAGRRGGAEPVPDQGRDRGSLRGHLDRGHLPGTGDRVQHERVCEERVVPRLPAVAQLTVVLVARPQEAPGPATRLGSEADARGP